MESFLGLVCVVLERASFLSPGSAAIWLHVSGEPGIIPASSILIAIVLGHLGGPVLLGVAAALAPGVLVGVVTGIFYAGPDANWASLSSVSCAPWPS